MAVVTLIEATPLQAAGTSTVTVRLGGGGKGGQPYTGYRGVSDWRGGLISRPKFASALAFSQTGFNGGAVPQTASIEFSSPDTAYMDTLAGYFWRGAKFTMWEADDEAPSLTWVVRMIGTVADHAFAENRLTLVIADASEDLAVPVAPDLFAGTGGIEGGSEAKGRVKRRNIGRVFNVEGRVLDKANNIYEFGDPGRPAQQFDAVKDKGLATGSLTVIGWAGSIAATLAALIASTPADGGGCVAPSIQCVKWWTVPAGPLTADIRGENAGGYVEKAADIANRIVTGATANIALTNVAAINTARPGPAGLHFDNASETVAQALDRLLNPLSLGWVLAADSTLTLIEWKWTGPVETVEADRVARQSVFYPLRSIRLGFQRNNRIHSDGEISAYLDDDLASAMAEISAIQADGILSANEKPAIIRLWTQIQEEKPYFDAQADDVIVSRTAYDTAANAVGTYLATLSPAWNDTTTNTPIVPATFNGKFNDYFEQKAILQADITDRIKAITDGKITTFRQGSTPTAQSLGDLWINTSDGNTVYRWNGSSWVNSQDVDIALAQAAAASAQSTADVKVTTFFTTSTPTAISIGDLWYNSTTKVMRRWNGSAWVDVATLGADWLSTLLNIPTAIGDGRVAAGLNSDGTVANNKVPTLAVQVGALATRAVSRNASTAVGNGTTVSRGTIILSIPSNVSASNPLVIQVTAFASIGYTGTPIPDSDFVISLNGVGGQMGTGVGAGYTTAIMAAARVDTFTSGGYTVQYDVLWRGGSNLISNFYTIMNIDAVSRSN